MAGVSTEQKAQGNKLEVDLNLVPFIDLLSTLVLFLLLTVVWIQIAAIPAVNEAKGKAETANPEQIKLIITLHAGYLQLSWPTKLAKDMPKRLNSLEQLIPIVQDVLKKGVAFPASVRGDDMVEYGAVIQALDQLKVVGLNDIALGTD